MRIKNLPSISSMDGSQDALIIEQTDGSEDKSRKVSPAQLKQYVLGNSIDDVYSVMGYMGAKNLMPYPYHDTTKTANGVTFTDNGDGTVTVSTESGGATADVTFDFRYTVEFTINNSPLKIGESYVLSCEDINSTASGYRLRMYIKDSNLTTLLSKSVYTSEGVEFVLPSNTLGMNIQIFIPSGTVLATPFTFKPMLRLAADKDNTYQPYAMTNKQLTEEIGDLSQTGLAGDSVAEQLGDAKGRIANLTSNALDNPIDIKNYTSSNRYQVPKDGYIRYRVRSGESGGCTIYGSNQSSSGYLFGYIITAAHDTREIIFVKKGMYVQNDGAYALDYVGLS